MSDRVTDKEQFIDAILVLYGTLLSDDDEEEKEDSSLAKARKRLKKKKLLEMPGENSKAEYLTRTFDEAGVEILKKAIEQDIHKFSHIPCMTDENFGGNVSGVALEFKLLGMENITKIKTRYYKKGLRKRVRIFCNHLQTSEATANFRFPSCREQMLRGMCNGGKHCLAPTTCSHMIVDHSDYLKILRRVRELPGVKKVFIRSGIRLADLGNKRLQCLHQGDLPADHPLREEELGVTVLTEHLSTQCLLF